MTLVTRLRVAGRVITVSGAALAGTLLISGAAHADLSSGSGVNNNNNFNVAAEGDAMQSTLVDPSAPLIQTYSVSPYGASASLNSLGQSYADAGAPYSPVIYGLPGTVNGLGSGGLLPYIPPLPGYTSSSYPGKPSSTEVIEGYNLTTSTGQNDSLGKVSLGAQAPGAQNPTMFATAETTANDDGSVTATATAGADLLNIGALLDIGNLSSTESLTVPPSGAPTLKSTGDVGTVTLVGLKSGLTLDGLNILGAKAPLPLNNTLVSLLNTLLAKSGVSLSLLPQIITYTDGSHSTGSQPDPSKTLQSVESGALQVVVHDQVPSQGAVSFTYTLGRAYVSATDAPGFGSAGPPPIAAGSSSSGGSLPASSGGPVSQATSPSAGNVAPVATTGAPSGATTSAAGPTTAPAATPGPSSQPQQPRSTGARVAAVLGPSNESLYLILLLGAVFAVICGQLLRLLAVRLTLFQGR